MTLKRREFKEIESTKGQLTVMWVLEDQKGWCINLKKNEAATTWKPYGRKEPLLEYSVKGCRCILKQLWRKGKW